MSENLSIVLIVTFCLFSCEFLLVNSRRSKGDIIIIGGKGGKGGPTLIKTGKRSKGDIIIIGGGGGGKGKGKKIIKVPKFIPVPIKGGFDEHDGGGWWR